MACALRPFSECKLLWFGHSKFFFFLKSIVHSLLLSHLKTENSFHDRCHPDYLTLPVLNQFFTMSRDEICNRCSWLFIKPEMFSACSDSSPPVSALRSEEVLSKSNPGLHFKRRALPQFQGKLVNAFLLPGVGFPDSIWYIFGKLKVKTRVIS